MSPKEIIQYIQQEHILDTRFFESIQACNTYLEPYHFSILEYSKSIYDIDWWKKGLFFNDIVDVFQEPAQTLQSFNPTQQDSFWLLFYTQENTKLGYWYSKPQYASVLMLEVSAAFLEKKLDDLYFFTDNNGQSLILFNKNLQHAFSIFDFGDVRTNLETNIAEKIELSDLHARVYSLKNENFKHIIRECKNLSIPFFENQETEPIQFALYRYTLECHEQNDHQELLKLYAIAHDWYLVDFRMAFNWFYENLSMNFAFSPTSWNGSIVEYFGEMPLKTLYNNHQELLDLRKQNLKEIK